mgnify:CR=1 FL=1
MEKDNKINIMKEDIEFIVKITNMSKKEKILLERILLGFDMAEKKEKDILAVK